MYVCKRFCGGKCYFSSKLSRYLCKNFEQKKTYAGGGGYYSYTELHCTVNCCAAQRALTHSPRIRIWDPDFSASSASTLTRFADKARLFDLGYSWISERPMEPSVRTSQHVLLLN